MRKFCNKTFRLLFLDRSPAPSASAPVHEIGDSLSLAILSQIFACLPFLRTNIINNNLRKSLQSSSVVDYVNIGEAKRILNVPKAPFCVLWSKKSHLSVCICCWGKFLAIFMWSKHSDKKSWSARNPLIAPECCTILSFVGSSSFPITSDSYWILIQFRLIENVQMKILWRVAEGRKEKVLGKVSIGNVIAGLIGYLSAHWGFRVN